MTPLVARSAGWFATRIGLSIVSGVAIVAVMAAVFGYGRTWKERVVTGVVG